MHPKIFRRIVSPLWQIYRGQKIDHYIDEFTNYTELSQEKVKVIQLEKILQLVRYCENHVPFYQKLFKDIGFSSNDMVSLSDYSKLPILTKETVRTHYDDFLSGNQDSSEYTYTQTSGSTGMSTKFRVSKVASERWYAAKLAGRIKHGVLPGEPLLWIWGRRRDNGINPIRQWVSENIRNEFQVSAFDITEDSADRIVSLINGKKICSIYGYSSAIFEFSSILKQKHITLPLKKVFTTAEKLYEGQRSLISEVFQCSVVSEYGAAEMGILAFECLAGSMHVVHENVYIEAVKSAEYGDMKKIIVTDMYNYAMPLLRYESGDLTSGIHKNGCSCQNSSDVLVDITGRQYDVIRLQDGRIIHGEMINYLVKEVTLKEVPCGLAHQFIQKSYTNFILYLAMPNSTSEEQKIIIRDEFKKGFSIYVGERYPFNLQVIFKNRINRSTTGKHRYILSEVKELCH